MHSEPIKLCSGGEMPVSIPEYNAHRLQKIRDSKTSAVCFAPYVNFDFDHCGHIRPCNHTGVAYGTISEDVSLMDIWQSPQVEALRRQMSQYQLDENRCRHCILQLRSRHFDQVFSKIDFDGFATEDPNPSYPQRLSMELGNTCNLACVTCNSDFSSRIRKDREKLPPLNSPYGERFYKEMEEVLPHVKHIAIFGGEPFLMPECLRLFEIIRKTASKCSLSISTNCMSLSKRVKQLMDDLNISAISMSMDAVDAEVHEAIRFGLKAAVFARNQEWLIGYARSRGFWIQVAATEHRKNWFQLPSVFRYAEQQNLHLHINHCLVPLNVTLYTLPTGQLQLVLDVLKEEKQGILSEFPKMRNILAYNYLLALISDELSARTADWLPSVFDANSNLNRECDGLLASPLPGIAPIETPEKTIRMAQRIASLRDPDARRMLGEMRARIETRLPPDQWDCAAMELRVLQEGIPWTGRDS